MRSLFFVNSLEGLDHCESTLALALAWVSRGGEAYVAPISRVDLRQDGTLTCRARPFRPLGQNTPALMAATVLDTATEEVRLGPSDTIFVRTNPARELKSSTIHDTFLSLMRIAAAAGILVVNHPDGLAKAASRIYLENVPAAMRPRTVITRELDTILEVAPSFGETIVLKTLKGTYGRDVFRVSCRDAASLRQIADILLREGFVVVQEFLPVALEGDLRVLVLDGELLEMDGTAAAIHRTPLKGDFRRNLDAGGEARPAEVTDAVREVVRAIGGRLVADGLHLCGLDFVGDKLVEVNVFSPGGLWHVQELTGVAFANRIASAVEHRRQRSTDHA